MPSNISLKENGITSIQIKFMMEGSNLYWHRLIISVFVKGGVVFTMQSDISSTARINDGLTSSSFVQRILRKFVCSLWKMMGSMISVWII